MTILEVTESKNPKTACSTITAGNSFLANRSSRSVRALDFSYSMLAPLSTRPVRATHSTPWLRTKAALDVARNRTTAVSCQRSKFPRRESLQPAQGGNNSAWLCDLLLLYAGSFLVKRQILVHHLLGGKIFGYIRAYLLRIEWQVTNPLDHLSDGPADVSRYAILHDLRDRPAGTGEHRRTAGHGFHHHQAERFVPLDRKQHGQRIPKQLVFCGEVGRP